MGLAFLGEREPQGFFGAGLADRPGDTDDLGVGPCAGGARETAQSVEYIGYDEQRCIVRELSTPIGGYDRECGFRLQRHGNEVVSVALILESKEPIARSDRTAVDRQTGHERGQRTGSLGPHRRRHRLDGPQRSAHAASSLSAEATAS